MSDKPAVVIYAAKSTEDKHGSIPTQIEDCRSLAEREGWEVVGEFSDEAFSAFSGNRGPGLDQAKTLATATAAECGRCALVAQDADRFARGAGDAPGAADHVGEIYFAMKRRGVELWTVRSGRLDLMRAAIEGERSHDETERKAQATRAGLKRRKERGQPVGPLPLGYRVAATAVEGHVLTSRIIDPATAPLIKSTFDLLAAGHSPGGAARVLNAEGAKTKRGKTWVSRAVRTIAENRSYLGENGYPKLIEPEVWEAANRSIKRMDPAAVQRRKGGRPADEYVLKGLAFCHLCGRPLYTRMVAKGRTYLCANVRQSTGMCTAQAIPAAAIEGHVLDHLEAFVGSAEAWLLDRVRDRDAEREQRLVALDRLRTDLGAMDRRRGRAMADYEAALEENDPNARIVLEVVAKIDAERGTLTDQIADAEAVVAEWRDATVDDALDYYAEIVDVVRGRIRSADGTRALNEALAQVVAGIWASFDGDRLHAEFELRPPDGKVSRESVVHLLQHADPADLEATRVTLRHTERFTFVYDQPVAVQISLYERPSAFRSRQRISWGFSPAIASAPRRRRS